MTNAARSFGMVFAAPVALGASLAFGETSQPSQGPDVIVGFVLDTRTFGQEGTGASTRLGISAATNSCNRGSANLNWYEFPDARHPVIIVNLYRFSNDRMEQLGQSWVKHGFYATNQTACFGVPGFPHATCAPGSGGQQLRPGCSDLYGAQLNADPAYLGPRSRINPTTGTFINPTTGAPEPDKAKDLTGYPSSSALQRIAYVLQSDLLGPADAKYYVESQYIAADDAAAGNARNNVTYREIKPVLAEGFINFQNITREIYAPAVTAWQGAKFSERTEAEAAGGQLGTVIIGSKATELSGDLYKYEYLIYNMNSHSAIQSLTIPTTRAQSSTIGSKAVPSYGELWSNDRWVSAVAGGTISWTTKKYSELPTANAIRWGTTYNFWFIADSPPATKTANITRFRPKEGESQPGSVEAEVIAPSN
jgi:hypothetical protein